MLLHLLRTLLSVRPYPKIWIHIVLVCWISSSLTAQLQFRPIEAAEPLPSSSNNAVLRDSRGLVWLANDRGLLKFDGRHLQSFSCSEATPACWLHNRILGLVEDEIDGKKILWISGWEGFGYLDLATEQVHQLALPLASTQKQHLPFTLPVVEKDGIWFGREQELYFVGKDLSVKSIPLTPFSPQEEPIRILSILSHEDPGFLWLETPNELLCFDKKNHRLNRIPNVGFIACMTRLSNGDLLVLNDEHAFFRKSAGQDEFYFAGKIPSVSAQLQLRTMTENATGEILLGTSDGLYVLFPDLQPKAHYTTDPELTTVFSSPVINDIYIDEEQLIWLSCYQGGVLLGEEGASGFTEVDLRQRYPDQLSENPIISSFARDQAGRLWMGTFTGQILIEHNARLSVINEIMYEDKRVQPTGISSMLMDRSGNMWLGGFRWGVIRIDGEALAHPEIHHGRLRADFRHFSPEKANRQKLLGWSVRCLKEGGDGDIWIGTIDGGLTRFDTESSSLERYPPDDSIAGVQFGVWTIIEGKGEWEGKMLLGTNKHGLFSLDKTTGKIRPFAKSCGLTGSIRHMHQSPDGGMLWIATNGNGLIKLRFDQQNCEWQHILYAASNHTNDAFCVLPAPDGMLWTRLNRDIYEVNPVTGQGFRHYTSHPGRDGDFFLQAVFRDTMSRQYFFGKSRGYLHFSPTQLPEITASPPIFLTQLSVNNRQIQQGEFLRGKVLLPRHIAETDEISLRFQNSGFTLSFTTLAFREHVRFDYHYRLKGYEEDWQNLPAGEQSLTYTNLPIGDYTLEIKLARNGHKPADEVRRLQIHILPEVYQQNWFIFLILLLIGVCVYCWVRLRTHWLEKKNQEIQHQVTDRTRALRQSYEDIRMLSELGKNITSYRDPARIILSLYEGLNRLMDASSFYIGRIIEADHVVEYMGHSGPDTPTQINRRSLSDRASLSVWSVCNQQELFLHDVPLEAAALLGEEHCLRYLELGSPLSVINIPLAFAGNVLGVLVVKSFRKHAFNDQHFNILSNLASYIAIALENGNAYAQIQTQEQERMRFYNNISHELRTPLTLILSPMDSLIASQQWPDSVSQDFQIVRQNVVRMQSMVEQLLEIGRMEEGKLVLRERKFELQALMRSTLACFDLFARQKQLRLRFHAEPEEIFAWIDGDKLEKILFNLLSNAVKYTPRGGEICLISKRLGQSYVLTVSDNGTGIPPDKVNAVFDRFIGQHEVGLASDTHLSSSGIGLAFVKKMVDFMHGKVLIQVRPEGGTKVVVKLPFVAAGQADNAPDEQVMDMVRLPSEAKPVPEKIPKPLKSRGQLLLVEDNEELGHFLQRKLSDTYTVHWVKNGAEALQDMRQVLPDLIISDVMMPVMDGFTLLKTMKESQEWDHIPVMLLTARTDVVDERNGLDFGADDYIAKPFNLAILKLKIRNRLSSRQNLIARYQNSHDIDPSQFTANPREAAFLQKVFDILDAQLDNPDLNVDFLADAMAMSRSLLFRKLKALTGESGKQMIMSYKIRQAIAMLRSGQFQVSEVSDRVGYTEPKYFSQAFRRFTGKKPSEFLP
ncbi:MAG: response regulator [Bacteroidota bacterium]